MVLHISSCEVLHQVYSRILDAEQVLEGGFCLRSQAETMAESLSPVVICLRTKSMLRTCIEMLCFLLDTIGGVHF